jgi:2-dehydropantoate 2-reductase
MRVLVFGAGAVGTYAGATLAQAGHAVTLVCRPEAARTISAHGVTVIGPQSSAPLFHAHPSVAASLGDAWANDGGRWDLILLAMKSYDVADALSELRAVTTEPPPLLAIQNGIGVEELIMAHFTGAEVIAGSVTIPLSRRSPDLVAIEKMGRGLTLAPTRDRQEVKRWLALWREAGVETTIAADRQQLKWSKALLNMVGNASAAILNMPPGAVYQDRYGFGLEVAMLSEALTLMAHLDIPVIDLPGSPARRLALAVRWLPVWALQPALARLVGRGRGGKLPSFLLDLNAGKRRSEVTFHNGAVARAGAEQGVPTPVNRTLTTVLTDLAAGRLPREQFEKRPAALAAAVSQPSYQAVLDQPPK